MMWQQKQLNRAGTFFSEKFYMWAITKTHSVLCASTKSQFTSTGVTVVLFSSFGGVDVSEPRSTLNCSHSALAIFFTIHIELRSCDKALYGIYLPTSKPFWLLRNGFPLLWSVCEYSSARPRCDTLLASPKLVQHTNKRERRTKYGEINVSVYTSVISPTPPAHRR